MRFQRFQRFHARRNECCLLTAPATSLLTDLTDVHSALMKIPAFHHEITQQIAVIHKVAWQLLVDLASHCHISYTLKA